MFSVSEHFPSLKTNVSNEVQGNSGKIVKRTNHVAAKHIWKELNERKMNIELVVPTAAADAGLHE